MEHSIIADSSKVLQTCISLVVLAPVILSWYCDAHLLQGQAERGMRGGCGSGRGPDWAGAVPGAQDEGAVGLQHEEDLAVCRVQRHVLHSTSQHAWFASLRAPHNMRRVCGGRAEAAWDAQNNELLLNIGRLTALLHVGCTKVL